eukprot:XP_016658799.1 PREDICTED: uncharacterized abhydrolase domain-containing protein DDB_G0269086 isoform X2 [Acyrthosiphon pisum]
MNSAQDSNRTHTTTSEFTTHAAVLLKQYYRDSWFGHNYDATSPLSEHCEQLNTKVYELLKCEIHKTFPQCDILKIQRIHAPQMYGMYLLRKAEMRLQTNGGNDIEKVLYHVTAESNAVESLIRGLDWRRNQRAKFGSGVSFSNDVDYSNYHANQSTNKEGTRVLIVNTVLMNDTYVVTEKWIPKIRLIIPPGTADTTVSPNGHVFVKYNDFESYPMFFVYYRWSPELRNESKFFVTKNNLQKLQQQEELLTLCQQVADICMSAESIRVKADLTAIATTAVTTKSKAAAAATPKQKQLSENKTVIMSRAAAKAAAAEVNAAATKAKVTAKAAAATKVAAAAAAKVAAATEVKAVAAAKVAAAAAAKVAAAATKAVAAAKVAAAAATKVAAAAEAKSVAATKVTAAAATPKQKQLSQKKTANMCRAAAKAAAAEVIAAATKAKATARSVAAANVAAAAVAKVAARRHQSRSCRQSRSHRRHQSRSRRRSQIRSCHQSHSRRRHSETEAAKPKENRHHESCCSQSRSRRS